MRQLVSVKVEKVIVEAQVRKDFDEDELRRLAESIKDVGVQQPLLLRRDGTLLAGERRLRAARMAGLAEVPAIITEEDLNAEQIRVIQLTENLHRADLTAWEKWQACMELLALNPGATQKDLANRLKLEASTVTRLMSPSKCIQSVQDALKAGKIGISDCYAISKTPADEQAALLVAKLNGASRDALERRGRRQRSAQVATVRVSSIKIALTDGVQVVIKGESIDLESAITSLGEAQKEARKARDQGLDAKTFQAVMRDRSKAVG
jgi:ParB/RepB/Spo0J family partition protein